MKVKMTEFGAPKGVYVGKFLGVKVFAESKMGRDGKPMGPAMAWEFEITEDPDHDDALVGAKVGRVTPQTPTAGNACGTLLSGLVDRKIDMNEEIDLDEFVGQVYRITIGGQKDNPEKTQVIQITKLRRGVAHPAAPSGVNPDRTVSIGPPPRSAPKPPPPRPAAQQPPPRYWVETGQPGDPPLMLTHEVNAWLAEAKVSPASVAACQEGTDQWRTLADYGFKDTVPF